MLPGSMLIESSGRLTLSGADERTKTTSSGFFEPCCIKFYVLNYCETIFNVNTTVRKGYIFSVSILELATVTLETRIYKLFSLK